MLKIFDEKLNNSKSKIIDLNKKGNDLGKKKHYPPANREWFNSVYSYNKNYVKSLPVADKVITKLIKSYFNLYSPLYEKNIKFNPMRIRFRRLYINKIFVSRAELKHTNDKVIITLYVYNRQKKYFINKLNIINKDTLGRLKNKDFLKKITSIKLQGLNIIKKVNNEKNLFVNTLKWEDDNVLAKKRYEDKYYESFVRKSLEKEILNIYYKHIISFNKSKFESTYLYGLSNLLSKVYNKKVEFNLVNLKYLHLNSDILSESITLKLKNRKNSLLRVLKSFFNAVKLPSFVVNQSNALGNVLPVGKSNKVSLNKTQGLNVNTLFSSIEDKDVLDQLLQEIFPVALEKETLNQSLSYLETSVFSSLKHKLIGGVRLEASGRLSKRFTAARSVFKFKYKGSLKNVDSSYKNLSTVMLRGHVKSNIQYTRIKSKTRNGSFGIKGWLGSI